jgi:hypothetical protein
MNAANLIEAFISSTILALTPQQRWGSATRGLNSSDASIPTWLIAGTVVTVSVLIISSVVVVYKQKAHKK